MNKGNVRKIMFLAALLAAGGCSSVPVQSGFKPTGRPILSAEDALSMITVTVTSVAPAEESDELIAAVDY
jgi:hypothetical protein